MDAPTHVVLTIFGTATTQKGLAPKQALRRLDCIAADGRCSGWRIELPDHTEIRIEQLREIVEHDRPFPLAAL